MPLFEVDARRSTLVQPLAPADAGFVEQAGPVVDDHVSRLLGEQVFPVAPREPGTKPEDAPHLLALDASGQPVVIEMVSRLDAQSLAVALAHAGRAARLSRADVADKYPEGARAFERAFAAFQDGTPIAKTRGQHEGSRLLLLCAQVDASLGDALEFLRLTTTAVSVLRLGVVTGPDGRRLVEVEPLYGSTVRRPRPAASAPSQQSPATTATPVVVPSPLAAAKSVPTSPAVAPTEPRPTPGAAPAPMPVPTAVTAPRTRASARAESAIDVTAQVPPLRPLQRPAPAEHPPAEHPPAEHPTAEYPSAGRSAADPVPAQPAPLRSPAAVPSPPTTGRADALEATSEPFTPRSEAADGPLPVRSRASRRREEVVGDVFRRPLPDDHLTVGLDAGSLRGGDALSAPLGGMDLPGVAPRPQTPPPAAPRAATPPPELGQGALNVPTNLPVSGEEDPDLSMLAAHLGHATPLVWDRPRRGQHFAATLLPTGQIELPGKGRYRNPDAAAAAAIGHPREDGWEVWRVGDNGRSLTEVFREQFA